MPFFCRENFGGRTVLADLRTTVIPAPLHRAGPAYPAVWRIPGVGAEAVGQTVGFWPAAGIGVGAFGVVGRDDPVKAVAVNQLAVLCADSERIKGRDEKEGW